MSLDIDYDDAPVKEHKHGLTDKGYVGIAVLLAVLTALEVMLTEIDLPGGVFMALLLFLMVMKFLIVVSYFMHLKFDNKIFTYLFYSGLILALGVYIAALAAFHFFSGG
ncbi:MAG TPA: cytochrome C oxidase subunit IV family protein [Ilumatobacteraceae bacterium]|nr:cytochrome C oxidase subunit IV family protein [Ilumatobacteraceae bacterium]